MKYAFVGGNRTEARQGLMGTCPGCNSVVVARCGQIRIHHWAHKLVCECVLEREPETEWHRNWKDLFPASWQEIRHTGESGEIHFADVKTDQGWVLEFQHSSIKPEERRSRDLAYPKLNWMVDGTKRAKDKAKFHQLLSKAVRPHSHLPLLKLIGSLEECALIRDWKNNPTPVFFDFGDASSVWYLLPQASPHLAYVVMFSRNYFIELHKNGVCMATDLNFWFNELSQLISTQRSKRNFRKFPNI